MSRTLSLTMIIPTYERPDLLSKVLRYHNDFPGTIIVADGSALPSLTGTDGDRVRLLHMPGDLVDDGNLTDRLRAAVAMVDTDYIMMHADRRITTANGYRAAVEFLDANPAYVAADGRYVLLSDARHASEDTKVYLSEISGLQKRYEAMAVFHAGDNAGVEQETPAERLEMAYFGFRPAFHAVVRAEVWRTTFARLPAACCNHFFNEIFFHHVLYIMGMRASLRVLFSALLPILHDQPFYNRRRFDPEMLTEAPVVEAEEALAELMAERTGNCMESCRAAVRTGFLEYLRFNPRPTLASHLATCEPEAEASLREVAECFLDAPVVW